MLAFNLYGIPGSLHMKLPYCVTVLRSKRDRKLYIGYSSNLKQRLSDHFNGKVDSTAPRRPLELIYCEYHSSKQDALRREGYFKTTAGKRAVKMMLREALNASGD
jgi:putative endonuclease